VFLSFFFDKNNLVIDYVMSTIHCFKSKSIKICLVNNESEGNRRELKGLFLSQKRKSLVTRCLNNTFTGNILVTVTYTEGRRNRTVKFCRYIL